MASKAVNRPVDEKAKETDINTKLQLFGIFQAFANGKVPSNQQIDVALNSAIASKALSSPSGKLSEEGRKLVADLKDIIEKAKVLLLTKNDGNLLQDFVWQTEQISGGNATTPNAPVDKEKARQHGNEALEGLRTLGSLIISNGQFRKLLNDAVILMRSIAGDAASHAAGKVSPPEDQLAQIDHPAQDDTWHEDPLVNASEHKSKLRGFFQKQKPEAQRIAGDATQAAHPEDSRDPTHAADDLARREQQGQPTGIDINAGGREAAGQVRDHVSQQVPDDVKDRARGTRADAQNYLKGKMPQERREQTIWRLKKMVVEIQGHKDYQRAVETLLSLAEQYAGHARDMTAQGSQTVKGAHTDDSLKTAETDLKTLLERFANSTSMDDIFDAINQIYRDADRDPELKDWFKKMDTYVRKCLQEQGFVMRDEATDEWNALYDQGEYLLRRKYRGHTDRILDEIKYFGQQFDADPQNKALGEAVQKLFLDLGNDESGKAAFKPHLLKDVRDVIVPTILENVRYVPIPRIEYTDPMVDLVIENLVLESDNLAPNIAEVTSDNYWRWGRKTATNKNKNRVVLAISGVQADLRDVSYYVKKKSGFPSLSDTGVMDIFLGGSGFSFTIDMETADKSDKTHFFKINHVKTDISGISLKVKKSTHKLLLLVAKPVLLRAIRPALQRAVEAQIKQNAHKFDAIIYRINEEARKAEADARANPSPENVQSIFQRYWTAAQQQIMQGQRKAAEVQAKMEDRKVNMAITQHDSIFPSVKLPGGISTKATEYKELAAKGDKWESPVFSIGSAKPSSNLPKLAAVRRRGGHGASSNGAGAHTGNGADGYADHNPNGAFASHMDQAFEKAPGANGHGANGHSTLLRDQNPVLTGAV
ncbi:hypothetical protein EJ06DRAFT_557805 [Trichodelitschia bisporula]|uniref:Uncharacterized protein n=1 Tax=Trichodelitschia bisporula TaxID=703511 RepID=A0A6G1HRR5_9PEZI|nr:hypothetical protein EJ06DRAFT_557805 [Trichodelitschia bisporula]